MELLEGTVPTPDSAQAIQALGLAWVGGAPLPVDRAGAGVVRSEQMPARNGVFGYNLSSPRQSIHAGRRSSTGASVGGPLKAHPVGGRGCPSVPIVTA